MFGQGGVPNNSHILPHRVRNTLDDHPENVTLVKSSLGSSHGQPLKSVGPGPPRLHFKIYGAVRLNGFIDSIIA